MSGTATPPGFDERLRQVLELAKSQGVAPAQLEALTGAYLAQEAEGFYRFALAQSDTWLARMAREREGFETRLLESYGRALRLFDLLRLASDLTTYTFDEKVASAPRELRPAISALRLLHARGLRVNNEIGALLRTGNPDGAHGRWRTAHEVAVIALYLSGTDPEVSQRYLDHGVIQLAKEFEKATEFGERLGLPTPSASELDEVRAERQRTLEKYGRDFGGNYGWAAARLRMKRPQLGDIAAAIDLEYLSVLVENAHRNVHSDSLSVLRGIITFRGEERLSAGTSNLIAAPAVAAMNALLQTNTALARFVALNDLGLEPMMMVHALGNALREARQAFNEAQATLVEREAKIERRSESERESDK